MLHRKKLRLRDEQTEASSSQPEGIRNIEYSSAFFFKEAMMILWPKDQNKSTLRGDIPLRKNMGAF